MVVMPAAGRTGMKLKNGGGRKTVQSFESEDMQRAWLKNFCMIRNRCDQ